MKYVAIDVRVGSAGVTVVAEAQQHFHDTVIRLMLPEGGEPVRLGLGQSCPLDHYRYVHEPWCIKDILRDALKSVGPVDAGIIDFTSNPFVYVRDPLLIQLAAAVADALAGSVCPRFAVLIPVHPGDQCASAAQFRSLPSGRDGNDAPVLVVANSGVCRTYPTGNELAQRFGEPYRSALATLYGSPQSRLARKVVRRMGHFRTTTREVSRSCRLYSYHLSECEEELYYLVEDWWKRHAVGGKAVLFDLSNNASLKCAVQAFADKTAMPAARVEDVLAQTSLADQIKALGSCVLVLDAVETGETLKHHAAALRKAGVQVHPSVAFLK